MTYQTLIEQLTDYQAYHQQKYRAPEKSGELSSYMTEFKQTGQYARQAFLQIVKSVDHKIEWFQAQRASNWMNQAQIARAYFYCFFKCEGDLPDEPGLAIRLYAQDDALGVSVEMSVLERHLSDRSLNLLHRHLSVEIAPPFYYMTYHNGIETQITGTNENRHEIMRRLHANNMRKAFVKVNVGLLSDYSNLESLSDAIVAQMSAIMPYYFATRQ